MIRISILLVIISAAFIGFLTYFINRDSESRSMRDKLLSGDEQSVSEGEGTGLQEALPSNRPRGPSDQLLLLSLPTDDERIKQGGPILLSVRGNLSVYRRELDGVGFNRVVMRRDDLEKVLADARSESSQTVPGMFTLKWDYGAQKGERSLSEVDAAALLATMKGEVNRKWRPDTLRMRVSIEENATDLDELLEWPPSGLGSPEQYVSLESMKPMDLAWTKLIKILSAKEARRGTDRVRVEEYEWVLP
jgi:hypothetical protein